MPMIEFKANKDDVPGYLALPEGESTGTHPGIVVVQEYWGLNDQIKGVADRLAGEGFIALVPDLYHGERAEEPDEAKKLAMHLDRPRAMRDIEGAVDYLVRHPQVEPKKAGIVGFCMGGGLAAVAAFTSEYIGAAVIYYGQPPLDLLDENRVAAPLLGLYGENDKSNPLDKVDEFRRRLAEQGRDNEIVVYPGAGHAFANEERKEAYNKEAAADAWKRTVAWLKRYLHYVGNNSKT